MIDPINPHTLTLIITHQCTSSCPNCAFRCSPSVKVYMAIDDITRYIDKVLLAFPTIQTLVFTGGEVSTIGINSLMKCIEYAQIKGIENIRIVTNAIWARSKIKTQQIINSLCEKGLTELNVSTGDEHLMFTPLEYVFNVLDAFHGSTLRSLSIAIEKHQSNIMDIGSFVDRYREYSGVDLKDPKFKRKINIVQSTWIELSKFKTMYNEFDFKQQDQSGNSQQRCSNVFGGIQINPNGQLLSCCGFAAEFSPLLKMGNIDSYTDLSEGYNMKLYHNLLRLWLYTEGPKKIIEYLEENKSLKDEGRHMCEYCIRLVANKYYIEKMLKLDREKIQDILCQYEFKRNFHINNF